MRVYVYTCVYIYIYTYGPERGWGAYFLAPLEIELLKKIDFQLKKTCPTKSKYIVRHMHINMYMTSIRLEFKMAWVLIFEIEFHNILEEKLVDTCYLPPDFFDSDAESDDDDIEMWCRFVDYKD